MGRGFQLTNMRVCRLLGIELDDEVLLDRHIYVFAGGHCDYLGYHVGGVILQPAGGLAEGVGLDVGLIFSRLRLDSFGAMTMPGFTWKLGMFTRRPFTVKWPWLTS